MPSAPNSRARLASSGVSALARIPIRRTLSVQDSSFANSPDTLGATSGTSPTTTVPVVPSMEMTSPSFTLVPPTEKARLERSMRIASAPTTQGLPAPRATTAACDVFPPRAVRIPWAAYMPWTSSGLVSSRTRITSSPPSAQATAVSASRTTLPTAAPGDALTPFVSTSRSAFGSNWGCRSWSICSGVTRLTAWVRLISFSSAISTAIRTAAIGVRLPIRVWSIQSLPCSIVNSMSHMSL